MMTGVIGFSEFLLRSLEPDDPRRGEVAGDHQGRHPRRRRHPPAAGLHPPAVPPPGGAAGQRRGAGPREDAAPRRWARTTCSSWRCSPEAGEIRADRGQLEQVLVNLMLNARDAMRRPRPGDHRDPRRGARRRATPQQHGGVGIPLRRVRAARRERHRRAAWTARRPGPHLRAVLHHQARRPGHRPRALDRLRHRQAERRLRLGVQRAGPRARTFKVYLPRVGAGAALAPDGATPAAAARGGSETILIVEDEEHGPALASRGLREHGYTVIEARHGADALRQLAVQPAAVDLVISDVVMPEMGGRELGRRLAALRPSLPVLYISGYTGEDVIQRGLLDPGAPFQQKPFAPGGAGAEGPRDARRGAARAGGRGGRLGGRPGLGVRALLRAPDGTRGGRPAG